MKCNNCDHENPKDSTFCEDCGNKLEELKEEKQDFKVGVRKRRGDIDDVLFVPKKSSGSGVWTVLGVLFVIGAIGVAFLAWLGSQSTSSSATSNSYNSNTTTTTTDVQNRKYFDLSQLQLLNTKMTGNSYGMQNPVFQATLHNSAAIAATKIVVRYNFYNSGSTDAVPVDTQYMKITDYLGPGDSTSINTLVQTNADTSGRFWWRAEVYSAEAY